MCELVVHFEALFVKQDLGQAFRKFLKTEFNEEPWLFLHESKKLSGIKEPKPLIETTLKIVEEYILPDAPKEINVSGKSKMLVIKGYKRYFGKVVEEWLFEECPELLFLKIETIVTNEMYHDPWRRFLRTQQATKLIQKYRQDSLVCSPRISVDFNYTDDYFTHIYSFYSDFKFGACLFEDDFHWQLVGTTEKNKMNTYISNLNYLPNVKSCPNIRTVKYECVLEVNFQRFLLAYLHEIEKSDPNVLSSKVLKYHQHDELIKIFKERDFPKKEIENNRRNISSSVHDVQFPYPLNNRILYQTHSIIYDENEKSVFVVGKPSVPEGMKFLEPIIKEVDSDKKSKKTKVYPFFDFFFQKYQKIDENKVLFSQAHLVEIGGWTNFDMFFNIIVEQRRNQFLDALKTMMEKYPEDAKISDFKQKLCQQKDGIIADGLGKLLYDLEIQE
eukprot:gene10177-2597_t